MNSEEQAYNELCAYTLSHNDPAFIHQHVVDAYAAQHINNHSKPIAITFALVGLYLLVEKRFTGKQIQRAHMQLAQRKDVWPTFILPNDRGAMTIIDVMALPAGLERDRAIYAWCDAVWTCFSGNREKLVELLRQNKIV